MAEQFVGEIRMFGFNFVPVDWLACDGSLYPIADYEVLYNLIGTTYGGNGTTTFAVPDLRGRVPINQGQGPGLSNNVIGQQWGVENVTLTLQQLPGHTHPANSNSGPGNSQTPQGSFWAEVNDGGSTPVLYPAYAKAANAKMASAATAIAGGSQPFSILQPSLCVNFVIAAFGIYPSQS